jgi:hypothetical protein
MRSSVDLVGMALRNMVVLAYLRDHPGASQQVMTEQLSMDSNTGVLVLNDLEDLEYVERRRDPADRRRHLVDITDGGREALGRTGEALEVGLRPSWRRGALRTKSCVGLNDCPEMSAVLRSESDVCLPGEGAGGPRGRTHCAASDSRARDPQTAAAGCRPVHNDGLYGVWQGTSLPRFDWGGRLSALQVREDRPESLDQPSIEIGHGEQVTVGVLHWSSSCCLQSGVSGIRCRR